MKEFIQKNVEQALSLKKQNLSYADVAEKMNRPVGTIKRWLAPYRSQWSDGKNLKEIALKGNLKVKEKYAKLRREAYESALENIEEKLKQPFLRDFVNIYLGEGSKRRESEFSIINSDPKIILLSLTAIKKYFLSSDKKIKVSIKFYKENNNEQELMNYWSNLIGNDNCIKIKTYLQPTVKAIGHNNSNKFGLVRIELYDTYAKQKLNAYMDYLKEEWTTEFEKTFNTKVDRTITEVKAQGLETTEVVELENDQHSGFQYPYLKKLKKMVAEKGFAEVSKKLGCTDRGLRKHIEKHTKKIVSYPDMATLKKMIAEKGYSEVARELGCSDRAVRKHVLKNDSTHIPLSAKKIVYPDIPVLISMVEQKGYLQVSKDLGCSDNAIRKHLKSNNIDLTTITRAKSANI